MHEEFRESGSWWPMRLLRSHRVVPSSCLPGKTALWPGQSICHKRDLHESHRSTSCTSRHRHLLPTRGPHDTARCGQSHVRWCAVQTDSKLFLSAARQNRPPLSLPRTPAVGWVYVWNTIASGETANRFPEFWRCVIAPANRRLRKSRSFHENQR